MKQKIKLYVLAIFFASIVILVPAAPAQTCRPPHIYVIVSDKKGNVIDPTTLKDKEGSIQTVSYFDDGNVAKSIKVLDFRGGGCQVSLGALTLKYRGQTMKLLFNVELLSHSLTPSTKFQVFSTTAMTFKLPPFQNGTFEYVWQNLDEKTLAGWKKISDQVLTGDNQIK